MNQRFKTTMALAAVMTALAGGAMAQTAGNGDSDPNKVGGDTANNGTKNTAGGTMPKTDTKGKATSAKHAKHKASAPADAASGGQ